MLNVPRYFARFKMTDLHSGHGAVTTAIIFDVGGVSNIRLWDFLTVFLLRT
jgi:hypothetical protein